MIGALDDSQYESNIIMLKPGDSIFFYTDGVTEAFNKNDEDYKEFRLEEVLKNKNTVNTTDVVNRVFESVQSFTEGAEQSDDITCMALKYLKG